MRTCSLLLTLALAMLSAGCMLTEPMREISTGMVRSFRPNPADYRDSTDDLTDGWKDVGIMARGDRAPTKRDPVDKWLSSEKASAIKWNLNYR